MKGVYEGGLKIWECSIDLADYLHDFVVISGSDIKTEGDSETYLESDTRLSIPSNSSVLELGCGHGLPAMTVLNKLSTHSLSQGTIYSGSVVFTDFNKEVIEKITWPNILKNCPSVGARCLHGDWDHFAHHSFQS